MNFVDFMGMAITVLCAVAVAFMFYFRVRGNVFGAVCELVAMAEASGLTGPEKMAQVVDGLYAMVPAPLKKILNKAQLERIAQWIFDWMRKYAEEYKKATEGITDKNDRDEIADDLSADAAAELIAELFNLTLEALKQKAEEYGIDLDGKTTKKEIIKEIVLAVTEKA